MGGGDVIESSFDGALMVQTTRRAARAFPTPQHVIRPALTISQTFHHPVSFHLSGE